MTWSSCYSAVVLEVDSGARNVDTVLNSTVYLLWQLKF